MRRRSVSPSAPSREGPLIYSIGHSTRPEEEFIELLRAHRVATLADIRTIPGSRRNPQFNRGRLSASLEQARIRYLHLPRLGGLRRSIGASSPNKAWTNASFRGFADYMLTQEFASGLEELLAAASNGAAAMMCAEVVPWKCHRSLVADALLARGARVLHIVGSAEAWPHQLTPFAVVENGQVTYPAD